MRRPYETIPRAPRICVCPPGETDVGRRARRESIRARVKRAQHDLLDKLRVDARQWRQLFALLDRAERESDEDKLWRLMKQAEDLEWDLLVEVEATGNAIEEIWPDDPRHYEDP
jgi:hypothetical protein